MTSVQISDRNLYEILEDINAGSFGTVLKIRIRQTGEIFALKSIDFSGKPKADLDILLKEAKQEYEILSKHKENVVFSYGMHWDDKKQKFYISMDFFPENLAQYIENRFKEKKKELTFEEFLPKFMNIANGNKEVNIIIS